MRGGGGGGNGEAIEYHCWKIQSDAFGSYAMYCFSPLPPARHSESLVHYSTYSQNIRGRN